LPEDKLRFKFAVVITEHHMKFFAMFLVLLFAFKENKLRDRGVVNG